MTPMCPQRAGRRRDARHMGLRGVHCTDLESVCLWFESRSGSQRINYLASPSEALSFLGKRQGAASTVLCVIRVSRNMTAA